ncbi:MAG: DUF4159 domain-containing protein [Aureliella sp.]
MFPAPATVKRVLTIILIVATSGSCSGQDRDLAEKVEASLQGGVRFLLLKQHADGTWDEVSGNPLGVTALCTLALLNAGVSADSPEIRKALDQLASRKLNRTYGVALQTMVFCSVNPNRYAGQIEANARHLMKRQLRSGGWGYGNPSGDGGSDPSNSQFALLGLHEAQRAGTTGITPQEWAGVFGKARDYWEDLQNNDGGFPYISGGKGRGSMTAAGIASLAIVGSQLAESDAVVNGQIQCCGSDVDKRDHIEEGFSWLAGNFAITSNPGYSKDHLYYLYALERAGRLTGRRFVGEHDWYREGAKTLLRLQPAAGGGKYSSGSSTGGSENADTAFGVLFLAKGKRQLVISRLKHGVSSDWNRHSKAVQNLTAHTEAAWKRDLTWQNIDLQRTGLQDLLDTPVLLISGTRVPTITADQKALLKKYVENGGFILAEGCVGDGCNGQAFEAFFNSLVQELFEKPLTRLPPEHPIWQAQARLVPEDLPQNTWLYGVETCCRLSVVYCPSSLTCRWELHPAYGQELDYPEAVQSELENFTKIGLNVLAYATGRELKEKLDLVTVLDDDIPKTQYERNRWFLPVLRHNAGSDDVPQAAPKLLKWLSNEFSIDSSSEKRVIGITTEELEQYPIAFMHGRGRLQLSEAQRLAIKEYLKNDGFILASAICGDKEFADSFRDEMAAILGSPLSQLDRQDKMLTQAYGGFDVRQVKLIDPDRSGDTILSAQRMITPRLEVGKTDRRVCVVFSPLDISCALESRHSLQCKGYVREDAARLGINVLLFAMQ